MFRMYGNRVEVLRYQIDYIENEEQHITYAATEEEATEIAARFNGTISTFALSDDEWMDGMEVANTSDSYAEAMKIYELGEQAYNRKIADQKKQDVAQLRADIDFLSAMTGVTL